MKRKDRELSWYQEEWFRDIAVSSGFGLLVTLVMLGLRGLGAASPSPWTMLAAFFGTTIVAMIISIMKRVAKIEIDAREHNEELAAGGEIDDLLLRLQPRLREVQAFRSAVFKTYCKQELESFVDRVSHAAQKGDLVVNEHHFRTMNDVLDAFGETNRVFRGVWKIEEKERLFDTAWQQYMRELVNLTVAPDEKRRIQWSCYWW